MEELEIEKRFLVTGENIEKLKSLAINETGVKMKDVYIPNGYAHKDLRLRQKGNEYMITRKRPVVDGDLTTMLETTIVLSKNEFDALSFGIESDVEKERFLIDISEWRGELDVFTGRHEGLVIIEFEFQNEADLKDFERNESLGLIDVTNVEWIAGGRLAEIDRETLREKLNAVL